MANDSDNITPRAVAEWMLDQLDEVRFLYQETVVRDIEMMFGPEFVYENENGNLAIDRKVLAEFRKISVETVIWDRGDKSWRKRRSYDDPGRQQY